MSTSESGTSVLTDPRIEEISNGFRLQSTDEYVVEVWRYLFNWRLVVMKAHDQINVVHGYCYFGTRLESLTRAVTAGMEWVDPLLTPPREFDKQAF